MSYIWEYAEAIIRQRMEDPAERDRKNRQHLQELKRKCDDLKATWRQPTKAYGYWNNDKNNHKYFLDLKLSNLSGRVRPYDKVKPEE
eukprot:SM000034S12722  [mRNA]  locus=s34:445124:445635:+ [translate_table: standard]